MLVNSEATTPTVRVTAKPFTGPVPKMKSSRAAEELGDVAVHDGPEHPVEARVWMAPGTTLAVAQLLLDALEDEDVGVHGHADGEGEAGDAGQGDARPGRSP